MRKLIPWIAVTLIGIVGMFMAHGSMLLTGFRLVQTDPVDTRLNNYFLEHGYRWLTQAPGHERFWDPPFFYPTKNVSAYSDILLTVAPPYWLLRSMGGPADTSFQIWMMLLTAVNYIVGVYVFRRAFRLSLVAAALSSFLFSFSAMRVDEITHQQLLPHAFTMLVVLAIVEWGRHGGRRWIFLGAASVVAQLYAGFYLGWFLVLALTFLIGLIPFDREWRNGAARRWKEDGPVLGVAMVLSALALWPMLRHYLAAARDVGGRSTVEVLISVADYRSWIYLGPHSLLYGWMPSLNFFHGIPVEQSHRKGIGLVTTVVVLIGLFLGRRRPEVRLITVLGIVLGIFTTIFPRRDFLAIGVALLGAAIVELRFRDRSDSRSRVVLGLTILGLMLTLFPVNVLAIGTLAAAVPGAVVGRLLLRPRTWFFAIPALVVWSVVMTYPDPRIMIGGSIGAVALVSLQRHQRDRGRAWWLFAIALLLTLTLASYQLDIWYWRFIFRYFPGGSAIRVVTRVGLLLLIPAGLGFGIALDRLWLGGRRSRSFAVGLTLICGVEQIMGTHVFDKYENRQVIQALVAEINPRWRTFFYSPKIYTKTDPHIPQIDAMWASMESGIPTINGYSGLMPPGWAPLEESVLPPDGNPSALRPPLDRWLQRHGIPVDEVGWIGPGPVNPLNSVTDRAPAN